MRRSYSGIAFALIVCMLCGVVGSFGAGDKSLAAEAAPSANAGVVQPQESGVQHNADASGAAEEGRGMAAPENAVTTEHTATVGGARISYQATAGKMNIEDQEGNVCEVFYTAYTLQNAGEGKKRPLLFAFNGGPGSASMWLHMGLLGPRRPDLDEEGKEKTYPPELTDNESSILDMTDIVFIDPAGTGYSRAAESSDEEAFIGYDNDVALVGDFIQLYVNRNSRWRSPKYIAGESYGTTRAVGVCEYLSAEYGMGLNGLMLISSIQDFSAVFFETGNDLPYVLYLPSYAAAAWYHKLAAQKYLEMELEAYLKEVREFAAGEYQTALFRGRSLSARERNLTAGKLAEYTGLEKEFIIGKELRIDYDDFCRKLMEKRKLTVGRFDSRITGPSVEGSIGNSDADPSYAAVDTIFANAMNQYFGEELEYTSDLPYLPLNTEVNMRWEFLDYDNAYLRQEDTIYSCMSKNSHLKVWVLCGYYDLATPFFSAEWVFDHVMLNRETEKNLRFTYYPAGHMFYLDQGCREQFRKDAEAWFAPESSAG